MILTNKFKKLTTSLIVMFGVLLGGIGVSAVNIEQQILPDYGTQGGNNYPQVIVSHEAGNPNNVGTNALRNEVSYMSRRWRETGGNSENAHYFVGEGGRIIQLLPDRRVGFHAGTWANYNGIGIELARTNDKNQFKKDYASYVNLHRMLAQKYGIPLTLDDGSYRGIKSHLWISNNIWGDHGDPYGYLSSMGISKNQFAHDLRNGVSGSVTPPTNNSGNDSKPDNSKPNNTSIKKGNSVTVIKAIQYDNGKPFYASGTYKVLEVVGSRAVIGRNGVVTSSIHTSNLKNVSNSKPQNKPQVSNESGWYAENATFNPWYAINVRYSPSVNGAYSGTLYPNQAIKYNAVKQSGGYVWIRYESYGGTRYMAVRPIGGQAWGSFY